MTLSSTLYKKLISALSCFKINRPVSYIFYTAIWNKSTKIIHMNIKICSAQLLHSIKIKTENLQVSSKTRYTTYHFPPFLLKTVFTIMKFLLLYRHRCGRGNFAEIGNVSSVVVEVNLFRYGRLNHGGGFLSF
jgi:hypothetical protein